MSLYIVDTFREKHILGKSQTITTEKEVLLEVEEDIDGWKEKESNFKDELSQIKELNRKVVFKIRIASY